MTITKTQLKQIIKEELGGTLAENSQQHLESIVRNYNLAPMASTIKLLKDLWRTEEMETAITAAEAIEEVFEKIAENNKANTQYLYNVALAAGKLK